jgi:hypothetical protein
MYNYCKTCFHDDGDIGFCDKCFYNHILEEKGIPPTEYEAKPKPQTNADRIRSMSDEELAEFFTPFYYDGPKFYCPAQADVGDGECAAKSDCRQCFLDWLQQEASDA